MWTNDIGRAKRRERGDLIQTFKILKGMNAKQLNIYEGQKILLFVSKLTESVNELIHVVEAQVGMSGFVTTELITANSETKYHDTSKFDTCIMCLENMKITDDLLGHVLRILKPGGKIWLEELVATNDLSSTTNSYIQKQERIASVLKMGGFVDVSMEVADTIQQARNCFICHAKKPNYEIGASVPLQLPSLSKNEDLKNGLSAAQVWTLSANDLVDDELLDSDTILEENDKKKPDPASLKVDCGISSGKRKACKNCNCGLAEKLDEEKTDGSVNNDSNQKASSCGSCYLGDAFRCAGCPYLGMPAFKPGEKVQLPL